MKKKYSILIIIFIACFLGSSCSHLFSIGDIYLDVPAKEEPAEESETLRYGDATLQALASFLSSYVQQPLWHHTRVPAIRDVLYLMPHEFAEKKKSEFAVNFFYNEVPHMKVTVGTLLKEDALLQEEEILELVLQNISSAQDRLMVASLFKKISLQERRLGFLLRAKLRAGPVTFQAHTSLQLDERNVYLSVTDRTLLLKLLQLRMSDVPVKECYRLGVGIGDTRLALGYDDLDVSGLNVRLGAQAIIPTSKLSYTSKYKTNIDVIADTADTTELTQAILSIVRNIRNYLLDPRFGNSGHFALGAYIDPHLSFCHDRFHLWGKLSYDMLFAAKEDRLFFFKPTPASEAHGNVSQEALNYLEQNVFPSSFSVRVCPSSIFNAVLAVSTDAKKTRWTFGYDFYAQSREHIKKIRNSPVTCEQLKVKGTESLSVSQHKLFAQALYKNKLPVTLGLGGDATVASINIGKDWTVYFKTTLLF